MSLSLETLILQSEFSSSQVSPLFERRQGRPLIAEMERGNPQQRSTRAFHAVHASKGNHYNRHSNPKEATGIAIDRRHRSNLSPANAIPLIPDIVLLVDKGELKRTRSLLKWDVGNDERKHTAAHTEKNLNCPGVQT